MMSSLIIWSYLIIHMDKHLLNLFGHFKTNNDDANLIGYQFFEIPKFGINWRILIDTFIMSFRRKGKITKNICFL